MLPVVDVPSLDDAAFERILAASNGTNRSVGKPDSPGGSFPRYVTGVTFAGRMVVVFADRFHPDTAKDSYPVRHLRRPYHARWRPSRPDSGYLRCIPGEWSGQPWMNALRSGCHGSSGRLGRDDCPGGCRGLPFRLRAKPLLGTQVFP